MLTYLPEFLTVVVVHLLGVMSPGPDFVMVTRNSLLYSRKTGVRSAVGLGLGCLVHVTYCLIGIDFIMAESGVLFLILKFLGAGYLIYIGFRSFWAKRLPSAGAAGTKRDDLGTFTAIRMGFLTNVSNPKAALFFLALFSDVISPLTPKGIQIIYGLEMSVMSFVWFAFVAIILSHGAVQARFAPIQHRLEKTFGVILVGLGLTVALTSLR